MALAVLAAPIVIMTSFFYDISRAYGTRSPCSHSDVILIVTPFATELATPTITDVRTPCRV